MGFLLVAVATSLPELSVSVSSSREGALSAGNIIGSNMANLTLVLGSAAVISPIEVRLPVFIAALLFAIVANSMLFYAGAINKGIGRLGGALFLALYVLYLAVIFGLQIGELGA